MRCDCISKVECCNCGTEVCPNHDTSLIVVHIKYKDHKEDHCFCSGACLFSWNLEEAWVHMDFYGCIDPTWIPVIRQLRGEMEKMIQAAIDEAIRKDQEEERGEKGEGDKI